MFRLNSIGLCLSLGIVIGTTLEAQAHSLRINSLNDFYSYYDPKNQYTEEQKTIVNSLFENVAPYFGEDGLENAIADGFVPFTAQGKGHGSHWFNPQLIDFTNIKANPIVPPGLNFDENGKLVAVFWAQERYKPILPLIQSLDLSNIDLATLPQLYAQYKQNNLQPEPDIFDVFGDKASWHYHQNVVIENIGARNSETGLLDPELVKFRQSLTNENFVATLLSDLNNPQNVVVPFEQEQELGYPYFNRLILPGFYMTHMWIGFGNHDGLFAETHAEVSPNGIDERTTFEDGSGGDGHGHGNHDHEAVPEPLTILGTGLALGFGTFFKRQLAKR